MQRKARAIAVRPSAPTASDPRRDLEKLVDFVGRDLRSITPGERLDFTLWATGFATTGALVVDDEPGADIVDFPLGTVQAELHAGLRALRQGESWHLSLQGGRRLLPGRSGRLISYYEGTARTTFLLRAADVLVSSWQLIQVCPRCKRLFVGGKRRVYCSPACSQKAQWEKFVAKHPERKRDHAAEYARRIGKKTGQKRIRRHR